MPVGARRIEIRDLLNPISYYPDSDSTTRPSSNLSNLNLKASNGAVQDQPQVSPDNIRYIPHVCQDIENDVYVGFLCVSYTADYQRRVQQGMTFSLRPSIVTFPTNPSALSRNHCP